MMKKILLLLTTAVLLYGCTEEERTERIVFTIFNETDMEVRIQAFDTRDDISGEVYAEPIAAEEIRIDPQSSYSVTRYASLEVALQTAFYSIEGVDEIRMTFNNERSKIYTLETAGETPEYNIFIGDDKCQHFIIQDYYDTAEICNGNCD